MSKSLYIQNIKDYLKSRESLMKLKGSVTVPVNGGIFVRNHAGAQLDDKALEEAALELCKEYNVEPVEDDNLGLWGFRFSPKTT